MSKYETNVPALGWNNLTDCAVHNLFVGKIIAMLDLVVFLVLVLMMTVAVMVMIVLLVILMVVMEEVVVVFPHCYQCVCGRYQSAKTPTDHVIAH